MAMAKVSRAKFNTHFYESGAVKYAKDEHYPLTAETESQIAAGNAEKVSVEMDSDEHQAQHDISNAAVNASRKATLAAEADAKKRGELK